MTLDPTCGIGNFCNHIPEDLFTGVEFDLNCYKVGSYLFPNANMINYDIQYWESTQHFTYILGNPPYNLKFNDKNSQTFILEKCNEWLDLYGIAALIVPESFLQDDFYYKNLRRFIFEKYSWLGQVKLDDKAFFNQYNLSSRFLLKVYYLTIRGKR
jgi:hypothetical protein